MEIQLEGVFASTRATGAKASLLKGISVFFKLCRRCCHSSLKTLNENFVLACLRPQ